MKPKTAHAKGLMAESLACFYLRLKGYQIITRRHKTKMGEVDIIARKGRTLHAIEVKTRAQMADSLCAVAPASTIRIRRAMEGWLQNNPQYCQNFDISFDLIAIAPYHWIRHIKNAF